MSQKPNLERVLGGLKDFQRRTADYVFQRLYGADCTRRFLIADEVGLGKTLVARGVVAQAIEHLWDRVERIDVLYICSSHDIARQNVRRLRIPGTTANALPSRLTLLPKTVDAIGKKKVNFVAFTPGTSFEHSVGGGTYEERILIYWMLDQAWGIHGRAASLYVLGNGVKADRFAWYVNAFVQSQINAELLQLFINSLKGRPGLRREFEELQTIFCRVDSVGTREERSRRSRWISDMRHRLAQVCLKALEPDLIILDEFQRFKHLLDHNTEAGELAAQLFDYTSEDETERARVLLLSATPYKMLSMHHEQEDSHYADFVATLRFLDPENVMVYDGLLGRFRDCLKQLGGKANLAELRQIKHELETRLRKVVVRTERLGLSKDRGGMLVDRVSLTSNLQESDVRGFLGLQAMSEVLNQGDLVEYWKSAPYLFNFMDAYDVKEALVKRMTEEAYARQIIEVVRDHPKAFLNFDRIKDYRAFSAGNPMLRTLIDEVMSSGAWQLLWLPPALAYYQLCEPFATVARQGFTKRLIFSSWQVVPKAIATVLSYEAERHMVAPAGKSAANTAEARKRRRGLLRFASSEGRRTGMPLFLLVYPCTTFAELCDPRSIVREQSVVPTAGQVIALCADRIEAKMRLLNIPQINSGPADEAWYWLGPILLDLHFDQAKTVAWWERADRSTLWKGAASEETEGDDRWSEHVKEAWETASLVLQGTTSLGRIPDDLYQVMALSAVAGPASVALRSLGLAVGSERARDGAAVLGKAFLAIFNQPETRELMRNLNEAEPQWLRALEYCHHGCLQAVFDEYVHILLDSMGGADRGQRDIAEDLVREITEAVTLRAAALRVDRISAPKNIRAIEHEPFPMRIRFAMRFGDERSEGDTLGDGQVGTRKERVRAAFNSPFWPFVLCTTSVGQEGLDFHNYCHAVVHWNLPANPVDLEQREGRVHRFKGLAVRKNVAAAYGLHALRSSEPDAWLAAFASARDSRAPGETDLVPYWLFPGEAKIERHIFMLPHSREILRYNDLRKMLAVYRMVFGQSRQEDLMHFLLQKVPENEREQLASELRINLSCGTSPSSQVDPQ